MATAVPRFVGECLQARWDRDFVCQSCVKLLSFYVRLPFETRSSAFCVVHAQSSLNVTRSGDRASNFRSRLFRKPIRSRESLELRRVRFLFLRRLTLEPEEVTKK